MRKILVLNAKGGSGKTTLATNLAAYYAKWGVPVYIADFDPQGSTADWVKSRPAALPSIKLATNYDFSLRTSSKAEFLIMDAPAATHGEELRRILKLADTAIIPVLPSPLDIRTAGRFVFEIVSHEDFESLNVKLSVVANRVRENTLIYKTLKDYLSQLGVPFLTALRDTQNYVKAVENGLSIFELPPRRIEKDVHQWEPLLAWLEQIPSLPKAKILHDGHVEKKSA